MWLTIVLELHLLPGSNVKIRFNAPSPGFAFQTRECTTSRQEVLLGIKILLPGRILAGILEKSFFLGGIPASTDFSAGFLPRYAAGIFPRKDPAVKNGPPQRDPGERRDTWRDPGEIPVPILLGMSQ